MRSVKSLFLPMVQSVSRRVHLADEIFVDLRRLGKKVVYARYDGEQHTEGGWGYANQVDYLNRIINWFDSYLKPPVDRKLK